MAIPLLLTLSATARLAYPFIVSGVRSGLSSRSIEKLVRGAGLPISRSRSILPLMRALKKIDTHAGNLRFTPKGLGFNTNLLPESVTDIRRNLSYTYTVTGTDPKGKFIELAITISTDNDRITAGELDSLVEDIVTSGNNYAVLEDITITLDFGIKKAGVI